MKICFINTLYPPNIVGGAEIVTARLAATLVRLGHQACVITLHDTADEKIEIVDGVTVYYLPLRNFYWPFKSTHKPPVWQRLLWHVVDMWNGTAAKEVGRILDAEKPDIVNSNNLVGFSVAVWAQAKKRGIKIIHTLHDYSLLCPRGTLYNKGKVCTKRCGLCTAMSLPKYIASRLVDEVVGVSEFVARQHKNNGFFPNATSNVIHNIVTPQDIVPEVKMIRDARFTFGFIGRIEEEKGIEHLLRAAMHLPKDGWRLVIAGRGRDDYVHKLKKTYLNSNVEWLGFVRAEHYYNQVDVSVVPSVWAEPLPTVIAEAGLHDIPVIISDIGGMPEFLEIGVAGVTVVPGDVRELARAMKQAMESTNPMQMRAEQKTRLRQELNEGTVTGQYLQAYQRCVKG